MRTRPDFLDLFVKVGKPLEARPEKSTSFTTIPEWGEQFSPEYSPAKFAKDNLSFSKFNCYTHSLRIFKSGEISSRSSLQSTGSNTDTTSPTNHEQPSEQPSSAEFENANIQQSAKDDGATIASRELAVTTLRQNQSSS